jgi:hypothetical protein
MSPVWTSNMTGEENRISVELIYKQFKKLAEADSKVWP